MSNEDPMLNVSPLPYANLGHILQANAHGGMAFLMRHAERYPLGGMETIFKTDLTEKGFADARQFGRDLAARYRIHAVYTSPVQRCINTGRSILQGAGSNAHLQQRWWLFSPFLHGGGEDADSVRIVSTEIKERGVASLDKQWLQMALQRMKIPAEQDRISLYISHDSLVTPMLGYLLGRDAVSVAQYPGYLDGVLLERRDGLVQRI